MIIGICGGSGSGKTTLLNKLENHYRDLSPGVFSMDNYYLPIEEQKRDLKGQYNFDLPSALDEVKMLNDLQQIVSGIPVSVKEYHFNAPPDRNTFITIMPSQLIIVEGLFLFHFAGIRDLLDYSIFVNVDPEIQLKRRLCRDQESRGYSKDAILYQWNNHVLPCFHNYLLPYRNSADFIFHNDERADGDFKRLTSEISRLEVLQSDISG